MDLKQMANACPPAEQGIVAWREWAMRVKIFLRARYPNYVSDFEQATKLRPPLPLVRATVIGGPKSIDEQFSAHEAEGKLYEHDHYVKLIRSQAPEARALLEMLHEVHSSPSPPSVRQEGSGVVVIGDGNTTVVAPTDDLRRHEEMVYRIGGIEKKLARVVGLLEALFEANELKRLVLEQPGGIEIIASVSPAESSPKSDFVFGVVSALHRRGLLNTFFDAVEKVRPKRAREIASIRQLFRR